MSTNPAFSAEANRARCFGAIGRGYSKLLPKNPPACEPAKRVAVETARAAIPRFFQSMRRIRRATSQWNQPLLPLRNPRTPCYPPTRSRRYVTFGRNWEKNKRTEPLFFSSSDFIFVFNFHWTS
ncbi:hypothetical protein AVEN_132077-1 [Araneus ventricosus]|uniref:Uncharacterized protein n=1 Tax=Araneus ventricosus TaxID=182803 RepID=A0A4Y2FAY7_ARAVE|nr:hypothetical protein AVEN_132077-1 [Araneus ventricosus]